MAQNDHGAEARRVTGHRPNVLGTSNAGARPLRRQAQTLPSRIRAELTRPGI